MTNITLFRNERSDLSRRVH